MTANDNKKSPRVRMREAIDSLKATQQALAPQLTETQQHTQAHDRWRIEIAANTGRLKLAMPRLRRRCRGCAG